MESAHINTVCISTQELPLHPAAVLAASARRRYGTDGNRHGGGGAMGKDCFAPVCSCPVPFSSSKGDLMDALFGLGRSQQTDESQREGERSQERNKGHSAVLSGPEWAGLRALLKKESSFVE